MSNFEDIKALIEEGNKAFYEHKRAVDQRFEEMEKNGKPSPETEEKLSKLSDHLNAVQDKIGEFTKERERLDQLEAQMNRPNFGGSKDVEKELKAAAEFYSVIQGRPVNPKDVDIEAYRDYRGALVNYLRKGDRAVGHEIQAALSVGSDPDGGYWVDPDRGGRIATLIFETSPVRQVASVTSIGTDALEGTNDLDEASAGWVGETESRSETNTPQIGEWRIPVHEQYANPRITQKLLDDAQFDVANWLEMKIADKLSREENTAFVTGNGVKKPRGFTTYSHGTPSKSTWNVIEQTASGAAGAFASSDPGDALIDMVFGLKGAYRQGAVFAMNRATLGEVRKLKDGQSNYLWQPDFGQMASGSLLGFPIVEMEDMADIAADSLSIAFGNFAQAYQIVDRQGIRVLRDPFTDKPYVRFYSTKRVGGDVVNFEAIKLMKFATSV